MVSLSPIVRFSGCDGDGKGQVPTKLKKSGSDQKNKRAEIDLIHSEMRLIDNLLPSGIVEDFVTTHFRRHPFVARGSSQCPVTLKKLLYEFNAAELLENSASERIHVWLSHKGSESSLNSQSLDSISVDDHTQAMKLYVAGHSIYCRAPLELERAVVPRLSNDLGLGVTGSGTDKYRRGEIELFLSRKGHATGAIVNTI